GSSMDNLVKKRFFEPKRPCMPIGVNEQVVSLFDQIITHTKEEKSGYQPLISGTVVHLLGLVHSISRGNRFEDQQCMGGNMVNKARILLRANGEQWVLPEKFA